MYSMYVCMYVRICMNVCFRYGSLDAYVQYIHTDIRMCVGADRCLSGWGPNKPSVQSVYVHSTTHQYSVYVCVPSELPPRAPALPAAAAV